MVDFAIDRMTLRNAVDTAMLPGLVCLVAIAVVGLVAPPVSARAFWFLLGVLVAGAVAVADGAGLRRRAARVAAGLRLSDADAAQLKRVLGVEDLPSWLQLPEFERVRWVNVTVERLWPFLRRALSTEEMAASLDPQLEAYRPDMLKKLWVSSYTAGTLPPKVAGVKVETIDTDGDGDEGDGAPAEEVVLTFDLRLSSDMALELSAESPAGRITVEVSDPAVLGKLRVRLAPLVPKLPCIGAAEMCFLSEPYIDMSLTMQGATIPGLEGAIRGIARAAVSELMVYPNQLLVPIMEGVDLDAIRERPRGVLYAKCCRATRLPNADVWGKTDAYLRAYIKKSRRTMRTDTVENSLDPVWGEYLQFIVTLPQADALTVEVVDEDMLTGDDVLGSFRVPVAGLEPGVVSKNEYPFTPTKAYADERHGAADARIHLELLYVPYDIEPERLSLPADWELPPSGTLTLTVHSASDLARKVLGAPQPFVRATLAGKRQHSKIGERRPGDALDFNFDSESITFVGVDPEATPDLLLEVFHQRSATGRALALLPGRSRKVKLGRVTVPIAGLARGGNDAKVTDSYRLEKVARGSLKVTLAFSRSEVVRQLRQAKVSGMQ